MAVTPTQARQVLARRELARRELARRQESSVSQPSAAPTQQQPSFGDIRPAPFGPPLRDYPATIASFANQALGGIPKALYEHQPSSQAQARLAAYGDEPSLTPRQYPEPQSWQGKLLAGTGIAMPFGVAKQGVGLATRTFPQLAYRVATSPVGRAVERGVIGATAGILSNLPQPKEYVGRATGFAAGDVVIPPLIGKAAGLFKPKTPRGLILTEDQIAKMPPPHRARYLEVQRMREEARLGRQIGHFEEQARLRQAQIQSRSTVGEEAISSQQILGRVQAEAQREATLSQLSAEEQNYIAALDKQRTTIDSMLTGAAKQKTVAARQPFFDTAKAHSAEYERLMRQALTTPEAQRAQVTMKELQEMVETLYPHPDDIADARLARNTLQLFNQPLKTTFTPEVIVNEIDRLALRRGSYSKLRVYSNRERIADDLRSGLLELMETKGVDVRPPKEYWRPWANVRNKAIKLIRPWEDPRFPSYGGARELEQAAQNMGPVEVIHEIEREIGFNLTDELKTFVSQQDANVRARLLGKVHFEMLREEAQFAMTRRLTDLTTRAASSTQRLQGVTARKLAGVRSEVALQKITAETASGRKMTRIEQLQRSAVQQAHSQQTMKRIMKRAIYGLAAYGGLKQVPVIKDVLP